jgi:hypothetical protein
MLTHLKQEGRYNSDQNIDRLDTTVTCLRDEASGFNKIALAPGLPKPALKTSQRLRMLERGSTAK